MHAEAKFVSADELIFTLYAPNATYAGKAVLEEIISDRGGNETRCTLTYYDGKPTLKDAKTGEPVEPDVYVMAAINAATVER